jgi:lipoprotein-anchoring transpeptidase ErfK/SrfK
VIERGLPRRVLTTVLAGSLALLAACGGGDDDDGGAANRSDDTPDSTTTTAAVDQRGGPALPAGSTWVARATAPMVDVYDSADAEEASQQLPQTDDNGQDLVFLVDGPDATGDRIPVLLPVPPNGSKGWVDAGQVSLASNPYRIEIELGAHRLTVTDAGAVVVDTEVGVGQEGYDTPTGTYYVKELLQPPDPNGAYGPYAYGISGFSTPDAAQALGIDGPGIVGIHGTNQPELLGTDVSHGCIRVANDVITDMAGYLPLGTPVEIIA